MIWAFFAFGSMWFWTLTCIWLMMLTFFVEDENTGWSFGSVIIFLAVIHLFGDVNLFVYLKENPVGFLQLAAMYIFFGIVWGISKFYFFNAKIKRKIESLKAEFIKAYDGDEKNENCSAEDKQREWDNCLDSNLNYSEKEQMDLSKQSGKVIFWISYWPVSAFWTILNDPLRRFGKFVYDVLFVRIFKYIHKKTIRKALTINE